MCREESAGQGCQQSSLVDLIKVVAADPDGVGCVHHLQREEIARTSIDGQGGMGTLVQVPGSPKWIAFA